jgi:hypothetical protein
MKNATFNPTDNSVTYVNFLGETVTESYVSLYARKFVVDHLNWDGPFYHKILTHDEAWTAYCMCDGFGKMTPAWHAAYGFDWSHVRDSSLATFGEVADYIARLHWAIGSIEAQALDMIAQANRAHLNPVELL